MRSITFNDKAKITIEFLNPHPNGPTKLEFNQEGELYTLTVIHSLPLRFGMPGALGMVTGAQYTGKTVVVTSDLSVMHLIQDLLDKLHTDRWGIT